MVHADPKLFDRKSWGRKLNKKETSNFKFIFIIGRLHVKQIKQMVLSKVIHTNKWSQLAVKVHPILK